MVLQTCQACPVLVYLRKCTGGKCQWWEAIKEQQQLLWLSDGQNPLWNSLHTVDLNQENVKKKKVTGELSESRKQNTGKERPLSSLCLFLREQWQGEEWGKKNQGQTYGMKLKQALSFHPTVRKKNYINFFTFFIVRDIYIFPHIPKWKTRFSAKGKKTIYKHNAPEKFKISKVWKLQAWINSADKNM